MKEQILNVINELMQLTESGKYKVSFVYSTVSNWFSVQIYLGEEIHEQKPFFSDSIMGNSKKWYSQWRKDNRKGNYTIPESLDLTPFILYLQQLRTAKRPKLRFDPTKYVTDDTQVL